MSSKIGKKVADILGNATPRQKALLLCQNWTDRNTRNLEPLITEAEAKQIRNSLKTNEEKKEFNKWIDVYNVYNRLMTLCGVVYKEYQVQAERVLGYLRVWEDYDQEENNLNKIFDQVISEGTDKQKEAFAEALKTLSFPYGDIIQDEDGYVEITRERLYSTIWDEVKTMVGAYEVAKSFVVAVEEWTKRKKAKAFMPELMETALNNIKEDYALRVAPKYSRGQLKALQAQGIKTTPGEEKIAVFPAYDEIGTPELYLDMFRERIKDIEAYG